MIYSAICRSGRSCSLKATFESVLSYIARASSSFSVQQGSRHEKRGLLDFVSNLAPYLFGTANKEQIVQTESKVCVIRDVQQREGALIAVNSHLLNVHKQKTIQVVDTVNNVVKTGFTFC